MVDIIFNGQALKREESKQGGKNTDPVNGFYRHPDGRLFFVKRPSDPVELVTEYLAGQLLQAFIQAGIISPDEAPSFVCADIFSTAQGPVLIQPCITFTPLCMVIGSHVTAQRYRSVWSETCYGPYYYEKTPESMVPSLAITLFFSLLIGDKSVHSDNVVCLKDGRAARLDFGAAFRDIGQNEDSVLSPYEYQGLAGYKLWTKNYFAKYSQVKGLHSAISTRARDFLNSVNQARLTEIIHTVLDKVDKKNLTPAFFTLTGLSEEKLDSQLATIFMKRAQEMQAMVAAEALPQAAPTERTSHFLRELDTVSSKDTEQEEVLVRSIVSGEEEAVRHMRHCEEAQALRVIHQAHLVEVERQTRQALEAEQLCELLGIPASPKPSIIIEHPATPPIIASRQPPEKAGESRWKTSAALTGIATSLGFAIPAIIFSKLAVPAALLALGITAFPFAGIIGGGLLLIGIGITIFLKIREKNRGQVFPFDSDQKLSEVTMKDLTPMKSTTLSYWAARNPDLFQGGSASSPLPRP